MTPAVLREAFPGSTVEEGFAPVTVDVAAGEWHSAVVTARTVLDCAYFDFLTAVDEASGPRVVIHLASLRPFSHLILRAALAAESPVVRSVADVYAGAGWHERETAEMFGITFTDASGRALDLAPLLLPPGGAPHPLRKEQPLAARLERPWPGAKGPGSPS